MISMRCYYRISILFIIRFKTGSFESKSGKAKRNTEGKTEMKGEGRVLI